MGLDNTLGAISKLHKQIKEMIVFGLSKLTEDTSCYRANLIGDKVAEYVVAIFNGLVKPIEIRTLAYQHYETFTE